MQNNLQTPKSQSDKPVWFITGCSTGFGREIANHVISLGYSTVVTSRDTNDLADFEKRSSTLALPLDVTDRGQVEDAVHRTHAHFGRIDVLVNNAGIGYFGAVEESEEKEVRHLFEVNFFGLCRMIHVVLPDMRARKKGYIVNLSSIGGLRAFPSLGYYCASKFAVEGLSESLWQEVESLGIRVMLVEPSGFRTDWAGRSADESKNQIVEYDKTSGAMRRYLRSESGHQAGDPVHAAKAIVEAVEAPNSPRRLLLGNDAYDGAMQKIKELQSNFSGWERVSRSVDYPIVQHSPTDESSTELTRA